jgi:hypothetical protein
MVLSYSTSFSCGHFTISHFVQRRKASKPAAPLTFKRWQVRSKPGGAFLKHFIANRTKNCFDIAGEEAHVVFAIADVL